MPAACIKLRRANLANSINGDPGGKGIISEACSANLPCSVNGGSCIDKPDVGASQSLPTGYTADEPNCRTSPQRPPKRPNELATITSSSYDVEFVQISDKSTAAKSHTLCNLSAREWWVGW